MTLPLNKNQIRRQLLELRRAIPPSEAQAAAQSIALRITAIIPQEAQMVAGYRPIQGELDPTPSLQRLIWRECGTCLPVTISGDKPLIFRAWQPNEPLVHGKFRVEEPLPSAQVVTPDVLLVPMVAFDSRGHRLGYGAGYYDRTIAVMRRQPKPPLVIGIAYHLQGVSHIPAQPHDELMDAVVTERESILLR